MDFSNESDFARRALYCAPRFGRFLCDSRYDIRREFLDLFLLFYVCSGSLAIEFRDRVWAVEENQVALLDCREPHRYYCPDRADFLWIHFRGGGSAEYGKLLYDQSGVVFAGNHIPSQREGFKRIIECARSPFPDEHFISASIHQTSPPGRPTRPGRAACCALPSTTSAGTTTPTSTWTCWPRCAA
jgi:hypothetical protein